MPTLEPSLPALLRDPDLGRRSHIIETLNPEAAVLTAVALAARVDRLGVVVGRRRLQALCRALGEQLAEAPVALRWGDGPPPDASVLVVEERVFFDGLGAEAFTSILPDMDHWLLVDGDLLEDRIRRALRTTVRDTALCNRVADDLGVRGRVSLRRLVPSALLESAALAGVPQLLREDPNRVFYVQGGRGVSLHSTVVEVAPVLGTLASRVPITVLGRALRVGEELDFAAAQLGLDDALGVVDGCTERTDLQLFAPDMPRASSRAWPVSVVDAARRAASVPRCLVPRFSPIPVPRWFPGSSRGMELT
ncbi:MAG: hypothetical protein KC656_13560, partial [Myxococcales bacterium]|nr:hypothetical protein [Myxococcales bacterium]